MIFRKDAVPFQHASRESFGVSDTAGLSHAGGLTQFGAYLQVLQPGARSSNRHWHEKEDEFLYVISGEVSVTENDTVTVLHPGDAACWPAGVPTAHFVSNRDGFVFRGGRIIKYYSFSERAEALAWAGIPPPRQA